MGPRAISWWDTSYRSIGRVPGFSSSQPTLRNLFEFRHCSTGTGCAIYFRPVVPMMIFPYFAGTPTLASTLIHYWRSHETGSPLFIHIPKLPMAAPPASRVQSLRHCREQHPLCVALDSDASSELKKTVLFEGTNTRISRQFIRVLVQPKDTVIFIYRSSFHLTITEGYLPLISSFVYVFLRQASIEADIKEEDGVADEQLSP